MSIFNKINNWVSNERVESESIWTSVETNEQIKEIIQNSNERLQVIYKHSRSCGTSFFAKRELDSPNLWDNWGSDLYMIDVIRNRTVSLTFADQIGLRHESPQLIILYGEKIVWHASHGAITREQIRQLHQKLYPSD